jgi:hypothetical protein
MTLFPQARWRGPVPNQGGAMGRILGLVLHIQEGSEAGTDAWFHNPSSKVSAHFGNPKAGPLDQWVEVGTVAWAEVNGNSNWISVENEGNSGDQLTPSQLENVAQLLAWLHTGYGVPLQLSDSTVPGLTGHGLGGAAWGGHYDCPGAPILAQRQAIINRAAAILGGTPTTGGTMPTIPNSIASQDPDLPEIGGMFPAGQPFDPNTAQIWTDERAAAANIHARQARDAINALANRVAADDADAATHLQQITNSVGALTATVHELASAPTGVVSQLDNAGLAAALAPLLAAELPNHLTLTVSAK